MKKFGVILITILVGTILYEIIDPAINPQWLRFLVEIIFIVICGFIGRGIFKATDSKEAPTTTE